jgi:hypothetical protein
VLGGGRLGYCKLLARFAEAPFPKFGMLGRADETVRQPSRVVPESLTLPWGCAQFPEKRGDRLGFVGFEGSADGGPTNTTGR